MGNVSILDQIIDTQKAEEIARLDAVEIIDNLFSELSKRERDVIIRRYGLHGNGKETLESIGAAHELTRERIRQIESSSVRKLQQLKNLDKYINNLKKVIYQLLEEHGGLMEKEYMLETLVGFSINGFKVESENKAIHKNYLNFLITKLLHKEFEEGSSSKHFKESYRLKFKEIDHLQELAEQLIEHIKESKRVFKTDELIKKIIEFESYIKNKEKFSIPGSIDISWTLNRDLFEEDAEFINKHKILYSILRAVKKIEQNKFGDWGIHNWREIKPKTINDKIYLIFKSHKKPMHFVEIADRINKIGFDAKKANPATVHNELILDGKYVLVGRGLYGLKEWGYKNGTVVNVIEEIFNESEKELLTRDEIVEKVLAKRMVKKATIILALMNKDKFAKEDGKYRLIKSI
ncbi:MAG: RNA polymerase sigma factor [Candidatus Falkowbacteria bacterium GW2011_GWC2_38_22]|uniref:RNA polymerase sigma factor n=1 Tax=Candidatus Falkowbacteria bacterium GW2011_GWE1_38_31 TaxID=1618638 RepID=A0A0G0JWM0_9BACT|nr:MAG: RNA polymerase sigma factor [Candidatus Falkowbacteria bacterium GW2011_GWF2_38_1205]KKQ62182.1 MAG: RNA polymerase sigma factor [Candidatus Falkowbacteria bacterium GW2011_GWC2_38_22]KKQ64332.1 MAG: RNA polymerase sigma factor [Candidatus Falkowbacteria bacterium GW2011_GWF1_38_22]KKQ66309.1 MAG: RNA polymerase sigma factor [Candidatus Falkowbacteria bacterium GW2011_GWE2_38_254]KKQ71037.1 MAG: RNA polymerase sigma factor [Candidatus Falkowbacteria bacterium GW2011_GWE1_38_31]KKQ73546